MQKYFVPTSQLSDEESMIRRLAIQNYKSISRLEMELGKLTILIGPNASGKSSVLDGLDVFFKLSAMVKGTWLGPFLHKRFDHYNELVHRRQVQLPMSFDVQVDIPEDVEGRLRRAVKELPHDDSGSFGPDVLGDRLGYRIEFKQTYPMAQVIYAEKPLFGVAFEYEPAGEGGYSRTQRFEPAFFEKMAGKVTGEEVLLRDLRNARNQMREDPFVQFVAECQAAIEDQLSRGFSLSEVREPLQWEVPLSGTHPDNVGSRGENTLNVLTYIANKKEFKEVNRRISEWVGRFGYPELASYVKSVEEKPHASSDALDDIMDVPINVAAAGFGFQQMLPIITQCFYLQRGGTLLVDEPEIHLHPANQMRMVDLLMDAVAFGNQVIITTHSEHMFLRLQHRVAEGAISPDDIAIHYVEKTRKGTTASRVAMGRDGSIPGWLPSFVEVTNEESRRVFEERGDERVTE